MSVTFGQIVNEIIVKLEGFGSVGDRYTYLTAEVSPDDFVLPVGDASSFGQGIIEIDTELMFCSATDSSAATLAIPPFGRGFRNTIATSHDTGSQVTMAPRWPRSLIFQQVQNQIGLLYPQLFAVTFYDMTPSGVQYQYSVDANVERIVDVRYLFNDVDGWQDVNSWATKNTPQGPLDFPTTLVSVFDQVPNGSLLRLFAATRPGLPTDLSSDFETATGLPLSVKDLVVLGVCADLVQFIDVAKTTTTTAEGDAGNSTRPIGTAVQQSSSFRQQYAARMQQEQLALNQRYPLRSHRSY